MRGENVNGVYYAPMSSPPQLNSLSLSFVSKMHHCLGHPSNKVLSLMLSRSQNHVNPSLLCHFYCTSCNINKSHKLPFSHNSLVSSHPLELIYSDVWSTKQVSSDGFLYYVIFVDHFTKYTWLYPMKNKSDVYHIFPQYKRLVEKRFIRSIISLFSDNGGGNC